MEGKWLVWGVEQTRRKGGRGRRREMRGERGEGVRTLNGAAPVNGDGSIWGALMMPAGAAADRATWAR